MAMISKVSKAVPNAKEKIALSLSNLKAKAVLVKTEAKTQEELKEGLKRVLFEDFAANFDPKIVTKKASVKK